MVDKQKTGTKTREVRWMEKFLIWIDKKISNSPKSKVIWRERDGTQYTALWIDKMLYMVKYHETAITVISSIAGAVLGCMIVFRY